MSTGPLPDKNHSKKRFVFADVKLDERENRLNTHHANPENTEKRCTTD